MPEELLYGLVSNLVSLKYYFIEAPNRQNARVNHPIACLFSRYANIPSRLESLPLRLASNVPSLAENLSVNVDSCLNDCGDGSTNDIQG